MNKLNLTLCFGLAILFLSSCERPDYTDEIHDIWFVSQNSENQECTYGEYECQHGNSYYCGYPDSTDYRDWLPAEECANGCDNSTGQCRKNAGKNDSDTTGETEHGDSNISDSDNDNDHDNDHEDSSDSDTVDLTADPCTPNPCSSITNSTGICTATDETAYSCDCNEGYEWNKTECKEKLSLPECNSTSGTPCKDSSNGLTWSARGSSNMTWQNALNYCNSYSEGGLSGWHLPTINELRTLIKNCSSTVTGGSCGVTDSCLSVSCWDDPCDDCSLDDSGKYSKLGDTGWYWSSSVCPNFPDGSDGAWSVYFDYGGVYFNDNSYTNFVRCVR